MANEEHLNVLGRGVRAWNEWREEQTGRGDKSRPDLSGANLAGGRFVRALFHRVDFAGADLSGADLTWANLYSADCRGANFEGADLHGATLHKTDLTDARLGGATLEYVVLTRAKLNNADISKSYVYGTAVWDIETAGLKQADLILSPEKKVIEAAGGGTPAEPVITINNFEVAPLLYSILKNANIGGVLEGVGDKTVLILGRFTPERKAVLERIHAVLRKENYVPILFDFEGPRQRSLTETVATLAHMSKFVVADITDASSVPQELARIVPWLPSVPVQPLLLKGRNSYGMFKDFRAYWWVLPVWEYRDIDDVQRMFRRKVIAPSERAVARARRQGAAGGGRRR